MRGGGAASEGGGGLEGVGVAGRHRPLIIHGPSPHSADAAFGDREGKVEGEGNLGGRETLTLPVLAGGQQLLAGLQCFLWL